MTVVKLNPMGWAVKKRYLYLPTAAGDEEEVVVVIDDDDDDDDVVVEPSGAAGKMIVPVGAGGVGIGIRCWR